MQKVAIFDIDGTIFRSSLFTELLDALVLAKVFPTSAKKSYEKEYRRWINRKGDYQTYLSAAIDSFMKHLPGVAYKEFIAVGERVVQEHKDEVYAFTRDLLKELKKKGYFLLAISQSPKGVLDKFCAHLGFDKVYGRFYELGPEDQFTGKITDLHLIANKANIVKRAVEKQGLTLKGSIAVGDTEGDIPMLEIVETPICFNPNKLLYRHAKINGWKVVVERKDVIYEIESGVKKKK
ncbi:MAG: HAD-IB family hydrolase [Patescibacteria group bacterium]